MSDFLDRAVARGLGTEHVVHRRREPVFAEFEDEGEPSPQTRQHFEADALARRAVDDEYRPDARDGFPQRSPVAAFAEPSLDVVPSRPVGSGSQSGDATRDVDLQRAQSRESPILATSTPTTQQAPRRSEAAAFTTEPRGFADDRPADVARHVPHDGRVRADTEAHSGRTVRANADDDGDAYRLPERAARPARVVAEYANEFARDVDDDVAIPKRRPDHFDEAPEAHLGTRNGAANARRVEDELTINVSIGSIEVARPEPFPRMAPPVRPASPQPSLDDYLQLRKMIRSR